jgi:2-polyprenyl-3-methyl-5-hydroxy-6-metoxy-1,4-benzoquinol methylase
MAASTSVGGGPNYDEKTYWTNRDYKTSARLTMQHWMWQHELGYALHPKIPEDVRSKSDLKVADVACGNGVWLFELRAPETAQLDGYDLSPNCFGSKEWLPKNVSLVGGFDALQPLKEELRGQYDIVHVRAFASIIKNNNIAPFIQTLTGLLSKSRSGSVMYIC